MDFFLTLLILELLIHPARAVWVNKRCWWWSGGRNQSNKLTQWLFQQTFEGFLDYISMQRHNIFVDSMGIKQCSIFKIQFHRSLTLTRPFQFGQITCNSVIRLLVKYVLMMAMVMVWYLGHFGRISFYKKSKKAEKVKMKEKLTEPYLTSRFHRLLENVYSMLKLCSHIVFTMFLAFLTCDIA